MLISVIWNKGKIAGSIAAGNGCTLKSIALYSGRGAIDGSTFNLSAEGGDIRLNIEADASLKRGPGGEFLSIDTDACGFTFFLRDVLMDFPIYIPEYSVMVTSAEDKRSYAQIERDIKRKGGRDIIQKYQSEPEESYESAAAACRRVQDSPTWLGLGRDIRLFEVILRGMNSPEASYAELWDSIKPRLAFRGVELPKYEVTALKYDYLMGRGFACAKDPVCYLEDGCLPILHAGYDDDGVYYDALYFVTNEVSPLTEENVQGTHYLVADHHLAGNTATDEQAALRDSLLEGELRREDTAVLYMVINCRNITDSPRYSWMRIPKPNVALKQEGAEVKLGYDSREGIGRLSADEVYMTASLDSQPVPALETALLLPAGGKCTYVFKIPHTPISAARAEALKNTDWKEKLNQCRHYWKSKLEQAMQVDLPDKKIEHMMNAGLLHLDLICYGRRDEPVAPAIGIYAPIGSESGPIIQYFDSVGLTELAARCLDFFYAKQHEDGLMINFCGYMLETGAVLYNTGLHVAMTGDMAWAEGHKDGIIKACDYIINWREKNMADKGAVGYGMIDGKVADPDDFYHSFMLNALAWRGLAEAAQLLERMGCDHFATVKQHADGMLEDIRRALKKCLKEGPVIPCGDGRWVPTCAPWTEYRGPLCLYADGGAFHTHGATVIRDSILGPIYLLSLGAVEPYSTEGDFILRSLSELLYVRHVAVSQPYYSTHPFVHLARDEQRAFLKEFYNGAVSLADRDTYSFWEHFFLNAVHKTHEEAQFLLRCRHMLFTELKGGLRLLAGAPDSWLKRGLNVNGANTQYGRLSFRTEPKGRNIDISIDLALRGERVPVEIRIPQAKYRVTRASEPYSVIGDIVRFEYPASPVSLQVKVK